VPDRDRVLKALRAQGIPAAIHYPTAAHDQPCFAHLRDRDLPVTERLCRELLSLPMHPYVTDAQAERVAGAVVAAVKG
jgi:UDP-2-acetamido-2-deoxy-ribo-hexuluronate aminotransferase